MRAAPQPVGSPGPRVRHRCRGCFPFDPCRLWRELSLIADEHDVLIAIARYLTGLLQVAFAVVLFGRLRYPVLTMLLGTHLAIAILMGLPFFSGAVIIADAVFLPDHFDWSLGRLWPRTSRRAGAGKTGDPPHGEPALVPPQPTPSSQ